MAGEKGAPRTTVDALAARRARAGAPPPAAERAQRLVVRAHRVPQGHGARGAGARRPRRGTRTRSSGSSPRSDATACWWSCGTTVTRSTVTATTRWSRVAIGGRGRRRRHQQRALRHARAAPARHRARRGAGPPFARRDRRLAPRGAVRAPAQRGASRPAASRAGPVRSSARSTSRDVRVRPAPRRARAARPRRPRRPHRDDLAARAHRARRARSATRRRTRSTSRRCTRSRTSSR